MVHARSERGGRSGQHHLVHVGAAEEPFAADFEVFVPHGAFIGLLYSTELGGAGHDAKLPLPP
jgi:hypothetical protein